MKNKLTQRTLSWLLVFSVLILQTGCLYERSSLRFGRSGQLSYDRIEANNPKHFFVHTNNRVLQLANVAYDPDTQIVTGEEVPLNAEVLKAYEKAVTLNIAIKSGALSKNDVKQVHFFVSKYNKTEDGKIQVNKKDIADTRLLGSSRTIQAVAATGVLVVGATAAFVIFLAIVCNCPHVYVHDGTDYVRSSNAFVGSVSKTLEQPDFALVPLKRGAELKVDIINEEDNEDQYVNEVKLLEIVHDSKTSVLPDQYGNIYSVVNPLKSKSNEEVNTADDGLAYDFVLVESKNDLYELNLNFDREANQEKAKLVLALKNTYWASYVMKEWYGLFGSEIDAIKEKNANRTAEAQLNWQKEQGITLSVFVKKQGKWVFQDDVNVVGNTIYRDLVVPIDLAGVEGETTSIKLVAGFKLWEVDYAGLDYSTNTPLEVNELSASTVLMNSESQLKHGISSDDEVYEHLTSNDTLSLKFVSNQSEQAPAVSYVLKTKGYYTKHVDQNGPMAKRELMSFRRKGQMSRYSRYLMENVYSEMSFKE